MITQFKIFENQKPEIDQNTIRVENKERESYIDFYFDNNNQLIYVDNKWHIKIPDWYGLRLTDPLTIIRIWAKREDRRNETFYIIKKDMDKYNI